MNRIAFILVLLTSFVVTGYGQQRPLLTEDVDIIPPGSIRIEAGIDFNGSDTACDVVLYSEFESRAALDGYQEHPAHLEMAKFIADRRSERRIADYEV